MIEILIDKNLELKAVQEVLSTTFGIPNRQVEVVTDVGLLPDTRGADVACVLYRRKGEFPVHLVVHVADPALAASLDECGVARGLASRLDARCLITDERVDPYTMTLVTGTSIQEVNLDAARLDDDDEYWISPTS